MRRGGETAGRVPRIDDRELACPVGADESSRVELEETLRAGHPELDFTIEPTHLLALSTSR